MRFTKVNVDAYLFRLRAEDVENRKKLEAMHGPDFAEILRKLMADAVATKPRVEIMPEHEDDLRTFVDRLNHAGFMGTKVLTPAALKNWKARRKTYSFLEIAEAFANLRNEPDQWQLRNNGFRPLSWWLEKDDRIETMKNCHLKASGKGSPIPQL